MHKFVIYTTFVDKTVTPKLQVWATLSMARATTPTNTQRTMTHKRFLATLILAASLLVCYAQKQQHTVRRGETYASIAQKYGITESQLKQANKSKTIYVGQTITIPAAKKQATTTKPDAKPTEKKPTETKLAKADKQKETKVTEKKPEKTDKPKTEKKTKKATNLVDKIKAKKEANRPQLSSSEELRQGISFINDKKWNKARSSFNRVMDNPKSTKTERATAQNYLDQIAVHKEEVKEKRKKVWTAIGVGAAAVVAVGAAVLAVAGTDGDASSLTDGISGSDDSYDNDDIASGDMVSVDAAINKLKREKSQMEREISDYDRRKQHANNLSRKTTKRIGSKMVTVTEGPKTQKKNIKKTPRGGVNNIVVNSDLERQSTMKVIKQWDRLIATFERIRNNGEQYITRERYDRIYKNESDYQKQKANRNRNPSRQRSINRSNDSNQYWKSKLNALENGTYPYDKPMSSEEYEKEKQDILNHINGNNDNISRKRKEIEDSFN